ncbi:ABC transporter ATP-binding protein [Microbacterium jiangjiandongii]|uniref:ABC transporter ATP-binding protein n=1 Tax=Microbacterium jiangjiandongii TaxID=3049071 RepID=UPI00214C4482|nr:ABC transporter ATP-binding protein [Microbacterium sp. zg.Y843]MCR2815015.1 ABC transporter ATP-binding protein [Microbacterium sp. zg.Y843]
MSGALKIDHLSQSYLDPYAKTTVTAVGDVDFEIPEGQFVSLIGPSGCGKTTVLNIVAGFIDPTGGRVLVDGSPVAGPGQDRGVVFQDFALFPWMTVEANIGFGLKMRGVPKAERRQSAREMARLVGLSGFEQKFPHELSGGMRQRAGVARVLATEPSIMLMDEPFASIDAQTRRVLQQEVLRIWSTQKPTVLFVTHDVEEAIFMSDRVIVLGNRPSEVQADIMIDLPRPRAWKDVQTHPEFMRLRSQLLGMLGVEDQVELESSAAVEIDGPTRKTAP